MHARLLSCALFLTLPPLFSLGLSGCQKTEQAPPLVQVERGPLQFKAPSAWTLSEHQSKTVQTRSIELYLEPGGRALVSLLLMEPAPKEAALDPLIDSFIEGLRHRKELGQISRQPSTPLQREIGKKSEDGVSVPLSVVVRGQSQAATVEAFAITSIINTRQRLFAIAFYLDKERETLEPGYVSLLKTIRLSASSSPLLRPRHDGGPTPQTPPPANSVHAGPP